MELAVRSAPFADAPLSTLRRSHAEAWVKEMAVAGLAPGTVRTRVSNVRAVLRAAVRDRVIARDPAEGVALPRLARTGAGRELPTPEDVGRLLKAGGDEWFRSFLLISAFAGLRLGETAGLQVGDVDFLARTLRVRRQVQRDTASGFVVRAPKYGSAREGVRPRAAAPRARRAHAAMLPRRRPGGWLFEMAGGGPPHQNTVGHAWRRTCRRAGVQGVTLHDLRHFYASGLIAAGCDVVTVQRALGHAKATTTLGTYAHLWPTAEDRTRAAAADLFAASCGLDADQRHPAAI